MKKIFHKPRPIWFYLAALSAALTIPILAVSAFMTWNFAQSEKVRLTRDVSDVNLQVLWALERQQSADIAMMRALATSPALRDGDTGSFRMIVEADFQGAEIILQD